MADLLLVRHDPAAHFARRHGEVLTAGAFLARAARLAAVLPERSHVINLCADRFLFAVGLAAALMRDQVSLLPPNQIPDTIERLTRDYPGSYRLDDRLAERPAVGGAVPARVPAIPEDKVAAVVFTSGSTGDPVPHPKTWGRLVASAKAESDRLDLHALPGMAVLGTVPPQHMFGFESTVLLPMQAGFVMQAGRPFFPADICAELEALPRPRALVTTPVHLRALLDTDGPLPQLDFMLSATAPLPAELSARAEVRFGAPLHEIYGCTEAGQIATRRPSHTAEWRLFPQFTLRQDDEGTWVKGGHATAELLLGDVIELRGRDRFLLHGRTADLVNIAGKRTSLASLDYHLTSIPGVRDGAFVVPGEADGAVRRLAAFAVAPGLSSELILTALRSRIDPAFLPRPLYVVDALPRNETGKLPRARLEELLAKAS
ncbi:MAG TPA: AMP-binding protein [Burkholderiales bacterium]|nr:AMP-binding protein [Burkholderiales bacterium]